MHEADLRRIRDALAGDRAQVRALVDQLTPVIQARVARTLLRSGASAGQGTVRQAVEDLVQECFRNLFANDGRVLRGWDPERGMGLKGYVGMVCEREVISVLRSRRRNPFTEDPVEVDELERSAAPQHVEAAYATRDMTRQLYSNLQVRLSPLGFRVFEALFQDELSTEAACDKLNLSADALYAWRSRIRKTARDIARELQEEAV